MLKSVLILSHALIIKLVSFIGRYVNRWGKIIVLLFDYFTLNAWSFLLAAVSLPLALFLQTQLHYCYIPSSHLISAKTTALLLHPFPMPYFCNHKHVSGVCVWASVTSFRFCLASLWERKSGEILNLVIPTWCHLLENLLFSCPAFWWSSWASAVPFAGRKCRSSALLPATP